MQVEESMLFVINNDGSTKIIQKRNWGKFIRRLNVREFDDASNIEEDNAHFDTIPETDAFSGTTEDMTNDDTNIADDDNPQPPGKCEEVHDEDTDIISKSEEDERESEDAGNIDDTIQETEDNPQPPGKDKETPDEDTNITSKNTLDEVIDERATNQEFQGCRGDAQDKEGQSSSLDDLEQGIGDELEQEVFRMLEEKNQEKMRQASSSTEDMTLSPGSTQGGEWLRATKLNDID
eukprot:scaffold50524_cov22-Cyclotella_meneghiniana.AAC.1